MNLIDRVILICVCGLIFLSSYIIMDELKSIHQTIKQIFIIDINEKPYSERQPW